MVGARSKAVRFAVAILAVPLIGLSPAQGAESGDGWFPVGPGAEGKIFSRTTTEDPFELRSDGRLEVEFNHVSVAPNGTTGLVATAGIRVVAVAAGAATVLSATAEQCASRTVAAGNSVIQPAGTVSEIRNDGSGKLELYTVSLTAAGADSAGTPAAGSCQNPAANGATTETLNRSVVDAAFTAAFTGVSDVYVAAARLAPRGKVAWHVQHRPLVAGVGQGDLGLHIAHQGRCELTVHQANEGFYEPPDMVHEVRNDTDSPGFFYVVGFAESPKPFLAPAAPPEECEKD